MYVKVEVNPDAKREKLVQVSKDRLKISVREPAERNLANKRVAELIATYFSVPTKHVRLISGHHSPVKMFSVDETRST